MGSTHPRALASAGDPQAVWSVRAAALPMATDRQLKAPTPSPPPPNGDFQFWRVVVSVAAGDSFFGEGWCAELGIVY